jgi:hypothetical protein
MTGSATIPQPSLAKLGKAARRHIAPASKRVDLTVPSFSDSTKVTNPLFPIGDLRSVVLVGRFNGMPWRAETSLLPTTRTIAWAGGRVKTLQSQFVAYLNGRIYEVAVDHYAQSDDGSVWYFGEDAFTYRNGLASNVKETWRAGVNGLPTMIMPGHPRVGDVYRPENIPGLIFEQVTVKKLGETLNGPSGPVRGAMVGQELHMEGDLENKTFAPGYGEWFSGLGRDYEATALAIPVDTASGSPPPALGAFSAAAQGVLEAVGALRWNAAAAATRMLRSSAASLQAESAPKRLESQIIGAADGVARAVRLRNRRQASIAALGAARAVLDLQLRYQPPADIDLRRMGTWAQELELDATAGDAGGVSGDVATMQWLRDRLPLSNAQAGMVDDSLRYLNAAAQARQMKLAAAAAVRLRRTLLRLSVSS